MVDAIAVLSPIHLDMSVDPQDNLARSSARSTTSSAASSSSDSELMSPRAEELLRMQAELRATRNALAEKDKKMNQIQTTVDAEVQELTEKLFQEAYKMVNTAEERREKAEKLLNESRLEVEVLQAEVRALKELIAAPGMGKHHFKQTTSPEHKSTLSKLFNGASSSKKPKEITVPGDKKKASSLPSTSSFIPMSPTHEREQKEADAVEEIDPILFAEFESWREAGHPATSHPFIDRVAMEEIYPCMLFENSKLSSELMRAIRENRVQLEPLNEQKPAVRICELTNASRFCPYRVRTGDDDTHEWHYVSLIVRNRIAAVCDFYTCIRYLSQGLIKPGPRDSFFQVVNLRKNMSLAKLGLGFIPRSNIRHTH
uniref:GDP/GTP exchange factor Sec2 N-terminal domain-containing protein n=1 Tax=Caenorhabditis japonica TaxID=281687 RepID=A0A8R1HLT4_CAEJA